MTSSFQQAESVQTKRQPALRCRAARVVFLTAGFALLSPFPDIAQHFGTPDTRDG
jgi:hypothetical protein